MDLPLIKYHIEELHKLIEQELDSLRGFEGLYRELNGSLHNLLFENIKATPPAFVLDENAAARDTEGQKHIQGQQNNAKAQ